MSQIVLKKLFARHSTFAALAVVLFTTNGASANPCPYNETDYLAYNPDVVYAIQTGAFASGSDHYLRHGRYENRVINRYCAGAGPVTCSFNETDYLAYNPDVVYAIQTGAFSSGYEHYSRHGVNENRVINFTCANGKCSFVARDYLDFNPDVAEAVRQGRFTSAEHHYSQHGRYENRIANRYCRSNFSN